MAIYVDDLRSPYAGMRMCHMIADSPRELFYMVDKIGVKRKWIQFPGTYREHFDICLTKRKMAVRLGAIQITTRELGRRLMDRRNSYGQSESYGQAASQGESGPGE